MCDCGCNTCETKKPVMLNESIAPKEILSEGLKYHMDNNMPLTEHVYRAGSQSYFNLWAEARALYSRGILEVTGDDLEVLTETDLGHFGMFEGKKVPLDFPIELNELETEEFLAAVEDEFDLETLQLMKGVIQKRVDFLKKGLDMSNPRNVVKGYRGHLTEEQIQIIYEEIKEKLIEEMDNPYFIIQSLKTGSPKYIASIEGEKPLWVPDSRIEQAYKFATLKDAKNYLSKFNPKITTSWHIYRRPYDLSSKDIGFGRDLKNINENRIIIKTKGKRLAIDKKDLQRLKSGKDIVGYSTKYPGQEEWVLARDKWEIEGPLNESKWKDLWDEHIKWVEKNKTSKRKDANYPSPSKQYANIFSLSTKYGFDPVKIKKLTKQWEKINDKTYGLVPSYKNWMNDKLNTSLNESKKPNKKLNKPMRDSSGGKAYKVYVKDPKTGNIKTVRFGSGGLRAKINDKKARNAFAKRHKCSTKKDKTKASYWSCRLPRYAKLLGLKSNFGGFW